MEIEAFINSMKDIYSALLSYIDANDGSDREFQSLIEILKKTEIHQNKEKVRLIFQLISKIADNHFRLPDFLSKLEKLFNYLIKDKSYPISDFITDYLNYNKLVLFLLLEKKKFSNQINHL